MKDIKLVRSRSDQMLSGVLGGLAPLLKIDVTILRLVFALITFFTGIMPGTIVYIICACIIPIEPKAKDPGKW
ncbi:PspC domain-containing protein [Neobacillus massiliamazoniensis]|uniref:Pspc domain protein, truncated n=1 Tax=Neobacillus massiliamazoniensis TaxID=1499688 RepID=A0A0U1NSR8_9BACI|nr:PspC domain-containing protein [Neobacillus massiliamazoniensis]CRK81093.1 pspc domain protein, truncated [Neobacillus massiliamazoniensis]